MNPNPHQIIRNDAITRAHGDIAEDRMEPTEVQLAILQPLLKFTQSRIILTPCFENPSRRQNSSNGQRALPGISGFLRASKHFSNLALAVLYGKNLFLVCEDDYDFSQTPDCDGEEVSRSLTHSLWLNRSRGGKEVLKLTPSAVSETQAHEETPLEKFVVPHERGTQVAVLGRVS